MTKEYLTIAVAKGYLMEESLHLFNQVGYHFDRDQLNESRKLFAFDKSKHIRLLFIRPWDVSAYVENGAADLGVVGKDVLLEKQEKVTELLDLQFGHCRLVIAGPTQQKKSKSPFHNHIRVATKYPVSCETYFKKLGIQAHILKMYGAVELAPLTGLADIICDLTASGQTLVENHLEMIDTVFHSTARLIANPVSLRLYYSQIVSFVESLRNCLNQNPK